MIEKLEREKLKKDNFEIEYKNIREFIKINKNSEEIKMFITENSDKIISDFKNEKSLLFISINSNNFEIIFFLKNEKILFKKNDFQNLIEKENYEEILEIYENNKKNEKKILEKELLQFSFKNGMLKIFKNLREKKKPGKIPNLKKKSIKKLIEKIKFFIPKTTEKNSQIINDIFSLENLENQDNNKNNIFHIFLKNEISLKTLNFFKILKKKNFKKIFSQKNFSGKTPFHIACISNQEINVIKFLFEISNKNILEEIDQFGNSPLFYACKENNFLIVSFLVEKGADLFRVNYNNDCCFDYLGEKEKTFFMRILNGKGF